MRAALALLLLSGAAHAEFRFAHGNDAFSDGLPPLDDVGFTTDLAASYTRRFHGHEVGGSVLHRWLTEAHYGPRREDLVELFATAARTWGESRVRELTVTVRTGPVLTGNWGGRWLQNGWHSVSGTGPTLDHGLAHDYIADRALGYAAGERAVGSFGIPAAQVYGVADTQLAVGTGVSSFELATGLRLIGRIRCTELGAHGEVALDRFSVADEALALPGGYGTGAWQKAWRVGVHVAWNRTMIAYEYRANEGGSGEPIGVISVTIKQSGHTF